MRYTELIPEAPVATLATIVVVGVVFTAVFGVVAFAKRDSDYVGALVMLPFLCLALSFAGVGATYAVASEAAQSTRLEWGNEVYGIAFTEEQLEELAFPAEEPGRKERTFGFTDVSVDRKVREVQLYWDGRDFMLLDADGKALPTRERVTGSTRLP